MFYLEQIATNNTWRTLKYTSIDCLLHLTNGYINKERVKITQTVHMTVQWMSGKSSLHFDTIMYYHILAKEFSYGAKVVEHHGQRWISHCSPLAETRHGK